MLSVAAMVALTGGCRRPPPRELNFLSALSALTNVAAFAEMPAGRAGRISRTLDVGTATAGTWIELAELRGSGCIRRIWSDAGDELRWRFFFDDETDPRLEIDTTTLFGGGTAPPFLPPLAESISGGRVAYLPLPYAQSVRVMVAMPTAGMPLRAAFQIDYTVFDAAAIRVQSFDDKLSLAEARAVAAVRTVWQDPAVELRAAADACGIERIQHLEPGETVIWWETQTRTPGVVQAFRLRPVLPPETGMLERARMLRALVLRLTWDDAGHPSVDVPLGDFFVNAWRPRRFASLPLGWVDDWYVSRFPMPFERAARAELRNDGSLPVTLHSAVQVTFERVPRGQRNYFHAAWALSSGNDTVFPVLAAEGTGHLAGIALAAAALQAEGSISDGVDELRIDSASLSPWRGTGLAAAFNRGDSHAGLFDRPLAGLVETAPMRSQGYRWFLGDAIPFEMGLDYRWIFAAEPPTRRELSATVYWYQSRPCAVAAPPPEARRRPADDPLDRDAIMCALFELERIGHYDEARDRAIEYYERHPGFVLTDFVRVRALGYESMLSGYEVVRDVYADVLRRVQGGPLGRELERLLWFHEAADRGLLATQINGRFRVYLNGERIEQGDNPTTLVVRPVRLRPGSNEIAVKVIPNKADAWLSLFLMTHTTNIVSGLDWEFTRQRPVDWPATASPDSVWHPVAEAGWLPRPGWWRIHPNIFVNMQSGRQLISPWRGPGWSEPPYAETLFRKRFVMPEDL